MDTDRSRMRVPRFWQRLSPTERLIAAVIASIAIGGLFLIADGIYMKAKASLSQVLLNRSFSAELAGNAGTKPWSWADFSTEARILAPRLGKSAIILSGATGEAMAFGPAHLDGTPEPGDEGTAVIAAHRDTHFSWLKDVEPGDVLEVQRIDGTMSTFRASGSRVARWDASGIDPQAFGHNLALTTCWPFDTSEPGPLRYIVEASLIDTSNTRTGMPSPEEK